MADSADSSRRKHMISWVETPCVSSLRASARESPSTTVPMRHPARDVRLRIEEDLGVPHALRGGAREIRVGEVGEVLLRPQYGHELVVQVQERLEIVEEIRLAQLFGVRVRQRDAVARGELEGQLGFEGAFDVEVQFSFGEGHQIIVRPIHHRFGTGTRDHRHRRLGTGTRTRSCATVSSPSNPAARACRSNSSGSEYR